MLALYFDWVFGAAWGGLGSTVLRLSQLVLCFYDGNGLVWQNTRFGKGMV